MKTPPALALADRLSELPRNCADPVYDVSTGQGSEARIVDSLRLNGGGSEAVNMG